MFKVRQIFMALCLPIVLLAAGHSALFAAQWHASVGADWWTVGRACRDGVMLQAANSDAAQWNIESFATEVFEFNGEVAEYPAFHYTVTSEMLGAKLAAGSVELTQHEDAFLFNLFDTIYHTKIYGTSIVLWDTEAAVGQAIALPTYAGTKYFVTVVEDCYIAPDAPTKTPVLAVKAMVVADPNACGSAPSIVTTPAAPVYACLVLTNQGDVTFGQSHFSDELAQIDTKFAFTITPGSSISITHATAQAAELPFALGPYDGEYDAENTFTWEASADPHRVVNKARITINRNNPAPQNYFMPIVKKEG
ncbi:MAG: hypothetical protein R3A44_40460 [Caldilineaceae bacterium]